MNEIPDDVKRARRLAEIRARRGSAEREKSIADIEQQKQAAKRRSVADASARKTPENSTDMYGHPWAEWFRMRDAAFDYICKCASEHRMTTYGELWNAIRSSVGTDIGRQHRQLDNLLGHVVDHTFSEIELIPTALVVSGDGDASPGAGFFRAAAAAGVLPDKDNPPTGVDWQMSQPQRVFWEQQRDGMFDRFAA